MASSMSPGLHFRDGSVRPSPAELLIDEVEYEVEAIRNHRYIPRDKHGRHEVNFDDFTAVQRKKLEFKFHIAIGWRGQSVEGATWEPESSL